MAKLLGMLVTVTLLFFPSQDAGGASAAVQSQGQPSDPSFDVASVKLNTSGPGPRFARPLAGGQFSAVNMPLSDSIQFAYGLRGVEFRVVGAPASASSTSYDVTARVDSNRVGPAGAVSMDDTRAMTRSLLRDRFTLIAHMESRVAPDLCARQGARGWQTWRAAPALGICLSPDHASARYSGAATAAGSVAPSRIVCGTGLELHGRCDARAHVLPENDDGALRGRLVDFRAAGCRGSHKSRRAF